MAMRDLKLDDLRQHARQAARLNNRQEFQINPQATRIQIAGADDAAFLIGYNDLAVQHVALSLEDVEALANQLHVQMTGGALDQGNIARARHDHAQKYTPAVRLQELAQHPAEGQEVSHRQHQAT